MPFPLAVSNKVFTGWQFPELCAAAKRCGFDGIEIAPETLGADPGGLSSGDRSAIRNAMRDEGLRFVGFHSLLNAPDWLQLSTPTERVRRESWDYFKRFIDLSCDFVGNPVEESPVLVLGSGNHRRAVPGDRPSDALNRLRDGLTELAPYAEQRGVFITIEALSRDSCNLINTLEQATRLVNEIGSPAIRSMFDTHNTVAERDSHESLLRQYRPYIRHVHLNEMDGRAPGLGDYDFAALYRALVEIQYHHWVSVEIFEFEADAEGLARRIAEYLRGCEYQR